MVRGPILFLAELFERTDFPPEGAIAADDINRIYNVYVLDLEVPDNPETIYWVTAFSGNYNDLLDTGYVQIILDQYLQKVESEADMLDTEKSYYSDGKKIYMNLPKKPWQYKSTNTEILTVRGFSSGPKSPDNPSDTRYGAFNYPTRLEIPSVGARLSNPISGINFFLGWNITLRNDDGYFDNPSENKFFNTPVNLLKTTVQNPSLSDFNTIRYGLATTQDSDYDSFKINIHDITRELEEEVCDKFSTSQFTNCPDNVLGKDIPRIWGSVLGIELFKIDSTDESKFYAGDGVTAVSMVYDKDGNSLSFTFDSETGIITEATEEAATVDVTGSANNMIGEMIADILEERSNIFYNPSSWDTDEADEYVNDSPTVDFYFKGGDVKKFISDLLKNDMAFLVQKNDGKLTLRKWGTTYDTHTIPSWTITGKPLRNFDDAKENFLSALRINYQKNIKAGTFGKSYYDESQQDSIFEEYHKKKLAEYELQLSEDTEVEALGDALLDRFGTMKETVEIALGYDTANINLLDTVYLELTINDRKFSNINGWIVKAVDTAQDKLTLEQEGVYLLFYDYVLGDGNADNYVLGTTEDVGMILGYARYIGD